MSGDARRKSWATNPSGSRVVFYGDMTSVSTYREAQTLADAVRDAVRAVCPEAMVIFNGTPEGLMVSSMVVADEIGVPSGGPMHRKAIQRIRRAMLTAMDAAVWLESEKAALP